MNRKTYSHTVAVPDEIFYKLQNDGAILTGTHDYYVKEPAISQEEWHRRYPNFDIEEVACRGTGELEIAKRLMDALQEFRNEHGPTVVTSAYRNRQYNKSKGYAANSHHCQGIAMDLSCHNQNPFVIREFFSKRGARGFKYYKEGNFCHVDWGLPFNQGFENAEDSKFSKEGKSPNQKKKEKRVLSGAAIIAGAPSIINSVGQFNLPSWFIMATITVGIIGGAVYWYINNKKDS